MGKLDKIVEAMRAGPAGVRYADLFKVCEHYFGEARQSGSSHAVFRTPWQGDPRVNIQNDHGKAKAYQVRQVLAAIAKLEEEQDTTETATNTEQGKEKKL
ncbi:toxin HicA [Promicromonospora sp. NPDC023805]|uniref:toxin HicA n=1 Tax=Promicromonospora sp. NPDC023805 TaxID=3154696 RepID=UPI00340CF9CC